MAAALIKRMDFYARIVREADCSPAALAVAFVLLYRHYNGETGRCDPGQHVLARGAGITPRSVKRATDELKEGGWFAVHVGAGTMTRHGPTTVYIPRFERVTVSSPLEKGERVTDPSGVTGDRPGRERVTGLSARTSKEPGREDDALKKEQDSKASLSLSASSNPTSAASANRARAPRPKGKQVAKAPENNLALLEAFTPTAEQLARLRTKAPTVAHKLDLLAEEFKSTLWWRDQFASGKYSDPARAFENFTIKQEGYARDRGLKPVSAPPSANPRKPLQAGTPEAKRAYDA